MNRADKIEEFLNKIDIDNLDLTYHVDAEEVNSFEDLEDAIEADGGFNVDIIYYNRALSYLMEHDASLLESTEIAHELGYQARDINSEVLASLLASQKVREDFYSYQDEIECFFEGLQEGNAAA